MKKILIILGCFFVFTTFVNAKELLSENLPYYVLIIDNNKEIFLQVKKIYDKDTSNVVFSTDFNNYDINNDFKVYDEYKSSIWQNNKEMLRHFITIVHYGYNTYQNDLYYYLTQLLIWQTFSNKKIIMVDEFGNEKSNYQSGYNKLNNNYNNHISLPSFTSQTFNIDLWSTKTLSYSKGSIILDNPISGNLKIENNDLKLLITGEKVSENKLVFSKYYKEDAYCYSDGKNIYWQSLGGPASKEVNINVNVYGFPIKIEENIIGINNRVGDAVTDSIYELYLSDELKLTTKINEEFYVKGDEKYTLKDISNSTGVINSEDINFEVHDEEIILNIDKYVISKNISFDILDDKNYYIYLKSNNELYEVVDNTTDLVTLPYGIYYITDDEDYYEEIIVENNVDELLVIDNSKVIEEDKKEETNILKQEQGSEEKLVIEEIKENIIENPKTLDDIYYYLIYFILSIILMYANLKYNIYTERIH